MRRLLCLLLCALFLCACSTQGTTRIVLHTGFARGELFRVDTIGCTTEEMRIYLVNSYNRYLLTFDGADRSQLQELVREESLALLSQIKAMQLLAAQNGVQLEEGEQEMARAAAQAYLSGLTAADREALADPDEALLAQMYRELALADKVYRQAVGDINPEISDDEARIITVEQILISKAAGRDAARLRAEEASGRIAAGEDFSSLIPEYSEAQAERLSFGRGEGQGVPEEAAFALAEGEVSDVLETEDAFFLLRCVSAFDREQTRANKGRILERRRREAFGAIYDAFIESLPVLLNEAAWEEFEIPEHTQTTSFMQCYEEAFGVS